MRRVSLLGATGSIGDSALDVVARHPDRYAVEALAANRNVAKLAGLCRRFRPAIAAMLDPDAALALERDLGGAGLPTRVLAGPQGILEAATCAGADTVLAAIVGAAGLAPTLAAARCGKRVMIANKEALVIGGGAFMRAAREGGAELLPIDSEHNALFQCLPAGYGGDLAREGVRRLVLTASGGPFRTRAVADLASVTPDEACAHPNWRMGRKVSVDSATMMNKGLEVIEAHWLFGAPVEAIDVVIHPQSIVHSMVEYADGSVLAQLGNPDMRTPIAQALAWPGRIESGVRTLDLASLAGLSFEAPDLARFPCLGLAYDALAAGGAAPVALNAANEIAVAAFLDGSVPFPAIHATSAEVLSRTPCAAVDSIEDALAADAQARRLARSILRLPADAGGVALAA
ncbi:MAG: 1-deoxy-D-xylulose-5-phosphate reductoisomerase [Burkholderiales bacterium]|jgi:1-deoxy-D-xylulose-5-phosphate reductoisomerase|nr:1-deoxy-D-xylulose-5-phosphate reductoisomerase [Burkholderiales bacterium]